MLLNHAHLGSSFLCIKTEEMLSLLMWDSGTDITRFLRYLKNWKYLCPLENSPYLEM